VSDIFGGFGEIVGGSMGGVVSRPVFGKRRLVPRSRPKLSASSSSEYWRKVYTLTEECWQLLPVVERLAWANGPKPRYLTGRDFFGRVNAIQIGRWQQFMRMPPPILYGAPPQGKMDGCEALPDRLRCQLPATWALASSALRMTAVRYRWARVFAATREAAWRAYWPAMQAAPWSAQDGGGCAFTVNLAGSPGSWQCVGSAFEGDYDVEAVASVVQRPGSWYVDCGYAGAPGWWPRLELVDARTTPGAPSVAGLWPTQMPVRRAAALPARWCFGDRPPEPRGVGQFIGIVYTGGGYRRVEVPV